jgi:hypothetical protein
VVPGAVEVGRHDEAHQPNSTHRSASESPSRVHRSQPDKHYRSFESMRRLDNREGSRLKSRQ